MSEKITSRQLQAIKSKEKIYEVAIELFTQKGYNNITIEKICKKAGVSKGLFYNYFSSKSEVLIEAFHRISEIHLEHYNKIDKSLPSEVILRNLLFSLYEEVFKSSTFILAIKAIYIQALEEEQSSLFDKDRALNIILLDIIESAKNRNEIKIEKASVEIAQYILINFFGVFFYKSSSRKLLEEQYEINTHIDILINGIFS